MFLGEIEIELKIECADRLCVTICFESKYVPGKCYSVIKYILFSVIFMALLTVDFNTAAAQKRGITSGSLMSKADVEMDLNAT